MSVTFPILPTRAAYLHLSNPARRNALSLSVLRDLRNQLVTYNTSPIDRTLRILPPFRAEALNELENASAAQENVARDSRNKSGTDNDLSWLVDAQKWREERAGLPNLLVLRSDGPVFSAGHDLSELAHISHDEVKETFALCAEVMTLIRRSPAPVLAVIQGLATAAGAQLALTCDLPVALAKTPFQLPGASLGLPCTSPSTAVSRRIGHAMAYRMFATAEPVHADSLNGAVDIVDEPEPGASNPEEKQQTRMAALDARVAQIVSQLADRTAGQPQALGKWAFWTQAGMNGVGNGGDGYEDAVKWTGRVMALHARSEDAREGMRAFLEKRRSVWGT